MFDDAVSHLMGQIQSLPVSFKKIHYSQTLFVVIKPPWMDLPQDHLSCMSEGRMAKVMSQGYGLCKVLIKT